MVVGFCWVLLFLFVPETTWDRTPVPKSRRPTTPRGPSLLRRLSSLRGTGLGAGRPPRSEPQLLDQTPVDVPHSLSTPVVGAEHQSAADDITPFAGSSKDGAQERGVSGSPEHPQTAEGSQGHPHVTTSTLLEPEEGNGKTSPQSTDDTTSSSEEETSGNSAESDLAQQSTTKASEQKDNGDSNDDDAGGPSSPPTTAAKDGKTISQTHSSDAAQTTNETFQHLGAAEAGAATHGDGQMPLSRRSSTRFEPTTAQGQKKSKGWRGVAAIGRGGGNDDGKKEKRKEDESVANYTNKLRNTPRRTFVQQLRPYYGRMHRDNWFKVAVRPLILYSYPSVLWSSVVYACSVGWLIVVSESVAVVYRNKDTYNFNAFQTGLVYLSPFVGGVLGTAVAGKVSDIVIKFMASRNGGLYEPEFRIVMALPVALSTVAGLMGFGWSAEKGDHWIVPTIFLGIISFGCTLGSTTAITFCVDSYRQYAGEALVTLNVSKNIFHGLVFSFFVTDWIEHSGPKEVYIWLGVIQLILLTFSIPMYIYGKRARMWTVRKNFMEKF